MPALINYKICDNSSECGGIAICPTKAMYYDEEKKSIVIDNEKCISCGLCRPQCPVSAIYVAKTDKEFEELKKEIEKDSHTIKDLFVDRYGATPISDFFIISPEQLKEKILMNGITLIELYNNESIQCLLKSIPIKEITDEIKEDVSFYKLKQTDKITSEYNIKEVPSLLIFDKGVFKGKVDGYFDSSKIELLKEKISQTLDIKTKK
jgi:NAD-dependent dihydropyrimidine dehydrogenase PreA subunit